MHLRLLEEDKIKEEIEKNDKKRKLYLEMVKAFLRRTDLEVMKNELFYYPTLSIVMDCYYDQGDKELSNLFYNHPYLKSIKYFIHTVTAYGSVVGLKVLLKKGYNIEEQGNNKCTPLHIAAKNGHIDIVQELLKNNAKKNPQDKNGMTPLQLAESALKECKGTEKESKYHEIVAILKNDIRSLGLSLRSV